MGVAVGVAVGSGVFVGTAMAVGSGVGLLQLASKDASMRIRMILDDDLDICAP